jgi:ribose 5-phosphate isomerase B
MSRRHNDANVMCLSADLLGDRLLGRIVEIWLRTEFEGGRHQRRIDKIRQIETAHPMPPTG